MSAKSRDKSSKNLRHIRQMKDKNRSLTKEESIKARWKEYFEELLNKANPRMMIRDRNPLESIDKEISREEVKKAMDKMKKGEAVGLHGIPAELTQRPVDPETEVMKVERDVEAETQ
ncbi:uncharacterized protein [Palaemon carinicauda]|uniref:uncharacterized protein n=1 Tax=Palaemon carinicauda TaxID=392227 RepID=UPI0035B5DEBF